MTSFKKKLLVLRQTLIGRGYFEALSALNFAQCYHVGFRKDGTTPEFDHQISIALYALTLPNMIYPEEVLATIMLHDVMEDYDVSSKEIFDIFNDKCKAERIVSAVEKMTKTFRGIKKNEDEVFKLISDDPIASIAKAGDRVHNILTMINVFSNDKQKEYLEETHKYFFPMIKHAKRKFPHQTLAYENIKHVLTTQVELINALLKAKS